MSDLDFETFLELAERWQALGWAIQEQLQSLLDGEPIESQNPNALRHIAAFLKVASNRGFEEAAELRDRINLMLGASA